MKVVALIGKEEFRAERLYQISLSIAETLLEQGTISKEEYMQIDTMLLKKYRPVLGTLLAGNPLA